MEAAGFGGAGVQRNLWAGYELARMIAHHTT